MLNEHIGRTDVLDNIVAHEAPLQAVGLMEIIANLFGLVHQAYLPEVRDSFLVKPQDSLDDAHVMVIVF